MCIMLRLFICIRSVVPKGVLGSSPAIHLYDYFTYVLLQEYWLKCKMPLFNLITILLQKYLYILIAIASRA